MGKRKGLGIKRTIRKHAPSVVYHALYDPPSGLKNALTSGMNPVKGTTGGGGTENPTPVTSNSRVSGNAMQNGKRHRDVILELPFKRGIGFRTPGPVFSTGASVVNQQFALDLTSGINHRNFTRMMFRSYHRYTHRSARADQPTVLFSKTLSAQKLNRTFDSVVIDTPVRDGNMYSVPTGVAGSVTTTAVTKNKDDMLIPLCTLQDLEIASWNANPMKFVSFNYHNLDREGALYTAPSVGSGNVTSLQVLKDWALDKTVVETTLGTGTGESNTGCASPFDILPIESTTLNGFTERPENYLCNLGPGTIHLQMQNRFNTAADIEVVVLQMRVDPGNANIQGSVSDNLFQVYEKQIDEAYLSKFNSGTAPTTGYGGELAVSGDLLTNPTKPFLKEHTKYMNQAGCLKASVHDRFRILAGASRKVSINLPSVVYDAYEHRRWWSKTAINTPADLTTVFQSPPYWTWPLSYCIYISVQGVLMPVFTSLSGVVGNSVVDTQTCPASVLIHGNYIERPLPCLSVSPTKQLQLKSEINDVVTVTALSKLVSGFVTDPPVATTTSKIAT